MVHPWVCFWFQPCFCSVFPSPSHPLLSLSRPLLRLILTLSPSLLLSLATLPLLSLSRSDFLVPDYLSQVQEEGSQGQYEELGEEPGFTGPSSSSVQLPVISHVSSSTSGCEGGLLSLDPPDPPDPLEAPALKQEQEAGVCKGLKSHPCPSSPSTSPDGSQVEDLSHLKELDAITIE